MKKIVFISVVLVIAAFSSCKDEDLVITTDSMLGRWNIKNRVGGLSTATTCEINEYLLFNADSTVVRDQCGQTTGTWYVQNEKLYINLQLDTSYAATDYSCELIDDDVIKAKLVNNPYIWVTYQKE